MVSRDCEEWASSGAVIRVSRALNELRLLRTRNEQWSALETQVFHWLEILKTVTRPVPSGFVRTESQCVVITRESSPVLLAAACSERLLRSACQVWFPEVDVEAIAPGWLSVADSEGTTPLWQAAEWGCLSVFAFLLGDLVDKCPDAWSLDLDMHAARYSMQPLIFAACSDAARALFPYSSRAMMDIRTFVEDSCAIACVLVKELPWTGITTSKHINGQNLAQVAAQNGLQSVLESVLHVLTLHHDAVDAKRMWTTWLQGSCEHGTQSALIAAIPSNFAMVSWLLSQCQWTRVHIFRAAAAAATYGYWALDTLQNLCTAAAAAGGLESFHAEEVQAAGRVVTKMLGWEPKDSGGPDVYKHVATQFLQYADRALVPNAMEEALKSNNVVAIEFVLDVIGVDACRSGMVVSKEDGMQHSSTTPLMMAAASCSLEVVKFLVDKLQAHGVPVTATDEKGRTAAHYAAANCQTSNLHALHAWYGPQLFSPRPVCAEIYGLLANANFDEDRHSHPLVGALMNRWQNVVQGLLLAFGGSDDGTRFLLSHQSIVPGWSADEACSFLEIAVVSGSCKAYRSVQQAVLAAAKKNAARDTFVCVQRDLHQCLVHSCRRGLHKITRAILDGGRVLKSLCGLTIRALGNAPIAEAIRSGAIECLRLLKGFGWSVDESCAAASLLAEDANDTDDAETVYLNTAFAPDQLAFKCLIRFTFTKDMVDTQSASAFAKAFGFDTPAHREAVVSALWACVNTRVTVVCTGGLLSVQFVPVSVPGFVRALLCDLNAVGADGYAPRNAVASLMYYAARVQCSVDGAPKLACESFPAYIA